MRSLTYRKAGVDIDKGESFVKSILPLVEKTRREGVLTSLGGFAGMVSLPGRKFKEPVIVASCDGVGTKLLLASLWGDFFSVGIDLVAMGVNDILTVGAFPLFFLDYIGTSKLRVEEARRVIEGIVEGCQQAECTLLGGETAEMPGMYPPGEYELVGFAIGLVEKERIIDGKRIQKGDIILGLASSGLHSNGYSLVRKIIFKGKRSRKEKKEFLNSWEENLGRRWGEELLKPTRIYVQGVKRLMEKGFQIKGIAHITGGGIPGNLVRIIPQGLRARIKVKNWEIPPIFSLLQDMGRISDEEMFKVFNMGIGLILVVEEEKGIRDTLEKGGEKVYLLGKMEEGKREVILE